MSNSGSRDQQTPGGSAGMSDGTASDDGSDRKTLADATVGDSPAVPRPKSQPVPVGTLSNPMRMEDLIVWVDSELRSRNWTERYSEAEVQKAVQVVGQPPGGTERALVRAVADQLMRATPGGPYDRRLYGAGRSDIPAGTPEEGQGQPSGSGAVASTDTSSSAAQQSPSGRGLIAVPRGGDALLHAVLRSARTHGLENFVKSIIGVPIDNPAAVTHLRNEALNRLMLPKGPVQRELADLEEGEDAAYRLYILFADLPPDQLSVAADEANMLNPDHAIWTDARRESNSAAAKAGSTSADAAVIEFANNFVRSRRQLPSLLQLLIHGLQDGAVWNSRLGDLLVPTLAAVFDLSIVVEQPGQAPIQLRAGAKYHLRLARQDEQYAAVGQRVIRSGAPVTLEAVEKEYGIPKKNREMLQQIADEKDVIIDVRPTNPAAVPWLEAGFAPKPLEHKGKTLQDRDVKLGAPSGYAGLAGIFDPTSPQSPSDEGLRHRFEYRQREHSLHGAGAGPSGIVLGPDLININGIVHRRMPAGLNRAGPTKELIQTYTWKPVTADHDLYDVLDARTGERVAGARLEEIIATLRPAAVEHPPHMAWQPTNQSHIAVRNEIVEEYQPGRAPLVRFTPTRGLAQPDTSRHEPGAPPPAAPPSATEISLVDWDGEPYTKEPMNPVETVGPVDAAHRFPIDNEIADSSQPSTSAPPSRKQSSVRPGLFESVRRMSRGSVFSLFGTTPPRSGTPSRNQSMASLENATLPRRESTTDSIGSLGSQSATDLARAISQPRTQRQGSIFSESSSRGRTDSIQSFDPTRLFPSAPSRSSSLSRSDAPKFSNPFASESTEPESVDPADLVGPVRGGRLAPLDIGSGRAATPVIGGATEPDSNYETVRKFRQDTASVPSRSAELQAIDDAVRRYVQRTPDSNGNEQLLRIDKAIRVWLKMPRGTRQRDPAEDESQLINQIQKLRRAVKQLLEPRSDRLETIRSPGFGDTTFTDEPQPIGPLVPVESASPSHAPGRSATQSEPGRSAYQLGDWAITVAPSDRATPNDVDPARDRPVRDTPTSEPAA
ncbi:hypothetical protein Pflav_011440 [Phytohabitans flavus]|uniref:Uncharacterized protein n=1 Tax=Phytohabitans flavus TaxID=1076124 RepID=A0A6F8XLN1_9ACTN|nr:CyaA/EF/ExoY family adenylyl cyclase toxin [Phytohabitans flavus]BCB74734.1 hypothetical protein Pflav_011440 [Phytohabitans flavus]